MPSTEFIFSGVRMAAVVLPRHESSQFLQTDGLGFSREDGIAPYTLDRLNFGHPHALVHELRGVMPGESIPDFLDLAETASFWPGMGVTGELFDSSGRFSDRYRSGIWTGAWVPAGWRPTESTATFGDRAVVLVDAFGTQRIKASIVSVTCPGSSDFEGLDQPEWLSNVKWETTTFAWDPEGRFYAHGGATGVVATKFGLLESVQEFPSVDRQVQRLVQPVAYAGEQTLSVEAVFEISYGLRSFPELLGMPPSQPLARAMWLDAVIQLGRNPGLAAPLDAAPLDAATAWRRLGNAGRESVLLLAQALPSVEASLDAHGIATPEQVHNAEATTCSGVCI